MKTKVLGTFLAIMSVILLLLVGCAKFTTTNKSTNTSTTVPAGAHVAGADYAKCHTVEHQRWATTLHATDPAAILTNVDHNTSELLTDECITCHAPFQVAKYKVSDFVQPINQTGPWSLVTKNTKAWQAIKCEVCHNPTLNTPNKPAFYDGTKKTYVAVADSTTLCEKCHVPGTADSRDLAGSVHQGMQCATCHFQKGSQMSLDPHLACTQCHPAVNPNHPDVTKLDTTYLSKDSNNDIHFIKCATCHPNGTPPTK